MCIWNRWCEQISCFGIHSLHSPGRLQDQKRLDRTLPGHRPQGQVVRRAGQERRRNSFCGTHRCKSGLISFFPSVQLSIGISVFRTLCTIVFLSFCPSIFLSLWHYALLAFCPSVFLSFYLSDNLFFRLFVSLPTCLSVLMSFCPSVFLSICLFGVTTLATFISFLFTFHLVSSNVHI